MANKPPTVTDEALAQQAQTGSLDAFEELVRRYEGRVHAFVVSICRSNADTDAVVQDAFVRAFQMIGRFNPRKAFAPWLFTLARNKAIDHLRASPPRADDAPLPEPCDWNDPAELLAQEEERQALWQLARQRLPAPQFQALWLRYAGEMDVEGIAQVLGKTRTHVKVLLFRARRTLGEEVESQRAADGAAFVSTRQAGRLAGDPALKRVRLARLRP